MDNLDLDDVCRQLQRSFDDVLTWKWDGRFGTALAEFPAEDKEKVLRILEGFLVSRWDSVTIGEAPEIVQQIKTHFGGLMSGQLLLLSDPDQDAMILCLLQKHIMVSPRRTRRGQGHCSYGDSNNPGPSLRLPASTAHRIPFTFCKRLV